MSVAQRFSGLLQANLDPELYSRLSVEARLRVRTFDEHLMALAAETLSPAAFDALRSEAERRQATGIAKAEQGRGTTERDLRTPPVKPGSGLPVANAGPPDPSPAELIGKTTHAQDAIAERFSMTLNKNDLAALTKMVRDKGTGVKLVSRQMVVREKYEVAWRGKRMWVVFNPHNGDLVTALPISPVVPKRKVGRVEKAARGNPRSVKVRADDDDKADAEPHEPLYGEAS